MVRELLNRNTFLESKSLQEAINKGAPVKEDQKIEDMAAKVPEENNGFTFINLRMPNKLLSEVDRSVKERIGLTRSAWIFEALQEKLKRLEKE